VNTFADSPGTNFSCQENEARSLNTGRGGFVEGGKAELPPSVVAEIKPSDSADPIPEVAPVSPSQQDPSVKRESREAPNEKD
jgi:hypothetical protein